MISRLQNSAASSIPVRLCNHRRNSMDVAGASFAGVFVPIIAVWLMADFGWRPGFAAFALLTMGLVVPLVIFVIHRAPEDLGLQPDGESVVQDEMEADDESETNWTTKTKI